MVIPDLEITHYIQCGYLETALVKNYVQSFMTLFLWVSLPLTLALSFKRFNKRRSWRNTKLPNSSVLWYLKPLGLNDSSILVCTPSACCPSRPRLQFPLYPSLKSPISTWPTRISSTKLFWLLLPKPLLAPSRYVDYSFTFYHRCSTLNPSPWICFMERTSLDLPSPPLPTNSSSRACFLVFILSVLAML